MSSVNAVERLDHEGKIDLSILEFAEEVCAFLRGLPEVKDCALYGSLQHGSSDEYSDVDVQIDVSGTDNGAFLIKLPQILSERFSVIFYDYAPSLAPDKYVVSVAMDPEHPFRLVDIACLATPHHTNISRADLIALNNSYDHILKLFSANLKHFLRGMDCRKDIEKMYGRVYSFDGTRESKDKADMLYAVFVWLRANAEFRYQDYLMHFEPYVGRIQIMTTR